MSIILAAPDATFHELVERAPGLTLVNFRAPWCLPCLLLPVTMARVARAYAGRVRVVTMNVDENMATMRRYDVRSIPTLLLVADGAIVGSLVGAAPLDAHLASRAA